MQEFSNKRAPNAYEVDERATSILPPPHRQKTKGLFILGGERMSRPLLLLDKKFQKFAENIESTLMQPAEARDDNITRPLAQSTAAQALAKAFQAECPPPASSTIDAYQEWQKSTARSMWNSPPAYTRARRRASAWSGE